MQDTNISGVRFFWRAKLVDGFVKGGLMIFLWLGLNFIIIDSISKPASDTVACIIPIATFFASYFVVEAIDKSISGGKRDYSDELYPENWEDLRNQVLLRDKYRCGNCGSNNNLHVHHIVPLSRGGTNNISNLRTLCEDCHKKIHPHMRG